jgi:hypothetical protein
MSLLLQAWDCVDRMETIYEQIVMDIAGEEGMDLRVPEQRDFYRSIIKWVDKTVYESRGTMYRSARDRDLYLSKVYRDFVREQKRKWLARGDVNDCQ